MLGDAARWVPRAVSSAVSWAVVAVVAVATTAGLVTRYLTPDDAPYPLLSREVGDHPFATAGLLALSVAAYVVVVLGLRRVLDAWRLKEHESGTDESPGRWARRVDWTYARWWRISLVLGLLWLPWYLSSFPGQPSPDPSNMITEMLSSRSDFAGAPPFAGPSETAPYLDYPTSSHLLTEGDRLWSNHHPFFLMLAFGSVCAASSALFDSLVPALVVLSATSVGLTLVGFGRALAILGAMVPTRRHRATALAVLGLSPLIALWSMAQHKNQLFCAAFVWWLALLARLVHRRVPIGRRWYVETTAVSLVMATTVQFGWIVLVGQALALLTVRGARVPALVAVALPGVLVYGSITAFTAGGLLIPSDPIETKGVQLQVLALTLNEHPDALTATQRAELSRIFDLDAFVASFDPSTTDPLKSTGPLAGKTVSFRYRTVQPEEWDAFDPAVLDVASRYPTTAVDAVFLKAYRYLDPFDQGTDWYPPWSRTYDRTIDGHQVAPLDLNLPLRTATRAQATNCYQVSVCRPLISHGPRTVAVLLLLAAAIGVRRRFAWLWALPFVLQLLIAGASPLSAGGRYVLGSTYGLAIVLLLLAVEDPPARPVKTQR